MTLRVYKDEYSKAPLFLDWLHNENTLGVTVVEENENVLTISGEEESLRTIMGRMYETDETLAKEFGYKTKDDYEREFSMEILNEVHAMRDTLLRYLSRPSAIRSDASDEAKALDNKITEMVLPGSDVLVMVANVLYNLKK